MELAVGPADFGDRYVATVTWRPLRGFRRARGANARGDDSARWSPRVWAWRVVTWPPLRGHRDLGLFGRCQPTHGLRAGRGNWASLWPLAWCRSQADLCTCRGSAFRRRRGHQRRRERFLIWASRALLYGSARWRGRERQIARQGERHRMGTGARRRTHTEECVAPSGDEQFQIGTERVSKFGAAVGDEARRSRRATGRHIDTSTGQKARPAHVTCGLPSGRGPRP